MAGARTWVPKALAMLLEGRISSSRGSSPDPQREGLLKGDAPPRVQGPRGVLHRSGGAAAGVHSQLRLDSWEKEISDPWVLATVVRGYRIQFRRQPPPFSRVRMTLVRDPVQATVLAEEVATLLQKDAIVKVSPSEQRIGFYSMYFLVPKKGGLRPVLDLRRLNAYVKVLPFKMLHTRHILESIEQGEWFTTIDLKDAYFHVPICPEHWQFLRSAFQGQAYEFKVLPFGLSLSPRVFTRVVAAALSPLQRAGIKILPYLDDWLVCAPSREQVVQDTEKVLSHVQSLCFKVNLKNSNLGLRQETVFVGLCLNSLTMKASLTPQRVARILAVLHSFRLGKRLELVHFQRLLGLISAAAVVIPLGLLRARSLQRWLNAFNLHPLKDRRVKLRVTQSCHQALRPWRDCRVFTQGVPLDQWFPTQSSRTPVLCLPDRLGSSLGGQNGERCLGISVGHRTHHVLELRVVYLALRALLPFIHGSHVLVRTNNSSTVYHVNHQGGTKSLRCLKVAQRLLFWAFPHLASLRAVYVPGVLNRAADLLSRSGPLPGEWRLHPEVVVSLWIRFGRAQANLFASRETTHCTIWFSLMHQSSPLGLDALSQEWPEGLLYAFPPLPLIPHVLNRITQGCYKVLLVAPRWPGRHWFPALLRLVHGRPWPLPLRADLLSQAGGQIWHPKPAVMQLWAWPLLSPSLRNWSTKATRQLTGSKPLSWHHDENNFHLWRAASTLRVYTAAISVFHETVGGLSVGKHPMVSQFLKGANRLRPGRSLKAPSWDLPLVLRSLATTPYEPLEQSDLKLLSHKTAFLLAICSARRVSELHAPSVSDECLRWKAENAGVSLWPNPFFLPKVVNSQTVNQAIEIEAFRPDPAHQGGVALQALCPRLSHWLVETVSQAYSSQNLPVPGGLVAHSTRSVATSLLLGIYVRLHHGNGLRRSRQEEEACSPDAS
ncbi:LOW QUALITY PROTEIN: uncharacterized protein [Centroberyx affinis]|uniref:LOW QUALITY PROTEIN: uncharacterized protein n=1 Tax=Centroberyx affinis TaxID=166261 RepID=UPI003A5BBBB2